VIITRFAFTGYSLENRVNAIIHPFSL